MMATGLKAENPYVGPRPFGERDRERFFGRDWETNELVSLVVAHPVVLLYAQSGAGKTSLINAGLIPLLKEEEFEVLPLARVRGAIPEDVECQDIVNLYVFDALLNLEPEITPQTLVNKSLAAFLEEGPRATDAHARPILRTVIFDQFEEMFVFYPERWRDREDFFEQVRDALEEDPRLRVVLVIREDYIAELDPYAPLLPEKLRIRFRLERLRKKAALSAIAGPLKDTNRSFAGGVAEKLVEDLLEVRIETAAGKTQLITGEFVEPVQLQVVCQSLWEDLPSSVIVITQNHLKAFGDVSQALSKFYESSIQTAAQQSEVKEGDLREWFECNLITPAGTRGIVYGGRKKTGGIPNLAVNVLENLHLIRAEWRAGARWYELAHDRFIKPIQESNNAWITARHQIRQISKRAFWKGVLLAFSLSGVLLANTIADGLVSTRPVLKLPFYEIRVFDIPPSDMLAKSSWTIIIRTICIIFSVLVLIFLIIDLRKLSRRRLSGHRP